MRSMHLFAFFFAIALLARSSNAQPIIAQTAGLTNPNHVITFGANLFPNFTNVSTEFPGIVVTHSRYFTTGTSNNLVGGFLTNDFSGLPNTLRITFAGAIRDLSFVYHQIATNQPSVFRAVLSGTVVDSFSNLSNQYQPNNYFGFTNVIFDELQLDFDQDFNVDTLAYNDAHGICVTRNGSNVNPVDYVCMTMPTIGTTWQCGITVIPNTITTYLALAPGGPNPGFPGAPYLVGEVLINLTPDPIVMSGPGTFSIPVPNIAALQGLVVATQAGRLDVIGSTPTFFLLNAIDLIVGM